MPKVVTIKFWAFVCLLLGLSLVIAEVMCKMTSCAATWWVGFTCGLALLIISTFGLRFRK